MELKGTKFHFIGIGGIGMCGLAELMHNMGALVCGSDLKANKYTKALKGLGVNIFEGHNAKNVGDVDVVVISSAVKKDNVEFIAAREKKIPIIPRAEALAEIMRLKRGIAVGGTHGKTTTTSLLASVFINAKEDPTIAVGGRLDLIKSTAQLGQGDWFIAEADESDGSFKLLSPEVVIVTNIDNDHMDYYQNFARLQQAFYEFAEGIPFYGTAIVCGDDDETRQLFAEFPKRIIFYGFKENNDFILSGKKSNYKIIRKRDKKLLWNFNSKLPGKHNALNATAALLAAQVAGVDSSLITQGIEAFAGVDRRFQFKGLCNGAEVYDDYAHHPTEVAVVLEAAKEKFPDKQIQVAFQPHRFTRLQTCWQDFLNCFSDVHKVYVLPVFQAGENAIEGVNSQEFVRHMKHENCHYIEDMGGLQSLLCKNLGPQNVFITLGAGDIWKLSEGLIK